MPSWKDLSLIKTIIKQYTGDANKSIDVFFRYRQRSRMRSSGQEHDRRPRRDDNCDSQLGSPPAPHESIVTRGIANSRKAPHPIDNIGDCHGVENNPSRRCGCLAQHSCLMSEDLERISCANLVTQLRLLAENFLHSLRSNAVCYRFFGKIL